MLPRPKTRCQMAMAERLMSARARTAAALPTCGTPVATQRQESASVPSPTGVAAPAAINGRVFARDHRRRGVVQPPVPEAVVARFSRSSRTGFPSIRYSFAAAPPRPSRAIRARRHVRVSDRPPSARAPRLRTRLRGRMATPGSAPGPRSSLSTPTRAATRGARLAVEAVGAADPVLIHRRKFDVHMLRSALARPSGNPTNPPWRCVAVSRRRACRRRDVPPAWTTQWDHGARAASARVSPDATRRAKARSSRSIAAVSPRSRR